ncbi:hypothetical protein BC628DRAFT_1337262 [Trametes gibbosa]|nr:hypothetical protein BC628DRAFT_1337262 [Trametes gibbosa]
MEHKQPTPVRTVLQGVPSEFGLCSTTTIITCPTIPASPIQLSSDSEAEHELTHQLEDRRQAKAARKAAQAAEATRKAKEERVAAEKVEEERKVAEKAEEERTVVEKAEEERVRAEKVVGKQVAHPTTAKVDPKGLPLVEPVTPCNNCKAAGMECLFQCGNQSITCQEERKKPCLGARGFPDDL